MLERVWRKGNPLAPLVGIAYLLDWSEHLLFLCENEFLLLATTQQWLLGLLGRIWLFGCGFQPPPLLEHFLLPLTHCVPPCKSPSPLLIRQGRIFFFLMSETFILTYFHTYFHTNTNIRFLEISCNV